MSVFSNPQGRATEAAHAYVTAILEVLGDRDPIAVLSEGPAKLAAATRGLSDDALRRPEREGKWSVIEVAKHLADTEIVFSFRMRLALAQDKPRITGFDQDSWARDLSYRDADLTLTLEQFRALREVNVALIRTLSNDQLQRVGMHEERGAESVDRMMRLAAGHDIVHLRQIERIRKGL